MAHPHAGHDHVWADDLTRNQELVLGTLAHATGPMSAYDILDKLRDDGLRAPLQVYRALESSRSAGWRIGSSRSMRSCAAPMHIAMGQAAARHLPSARSAAGSKNSPSR